MTMSIIKPNVLTDAGLTSSTAAEADYPAWSAATNYTVGANVMRAVSGVHKNFQALIAGVDAGLPELTPARWLDLGPTNRWAMFDQSVGTVTTVSGDLTVVLRPGSVSGIALLELQGREVNITMKDAPGGAVIYSKNILLDGTSVASFYDWFYEPYIQLSYVVATGLPTHFVSSELTITVASTTTAACGVCHFGDLIEVGRTQKGATVGIVDYSRKTVDAFGNYSITQRAFSKRAELKLVTDAGQFNRIYKALAGVRSTPCVFVATEALGFEPMVIYGFYKDFSIDVAYQSIHLCNLSIEGLI